MTPWLLWSTAHVDGIDMSEFPQPTLVCIAAKVKQSEENCRGGLAILYPLVPATSAKLPAAISSLKLLYTLARGPAESSLRPRFRIARENKSSIHLSTVAASV